MHAPLSDPGGVLRTRHSAPRTVAFRPLDTVGFPFGTAEGYPCVHDSTHFGAQSRGLHLRSIQLRTPITGCARGCHYRSAGEAFIGWDLSHLGSHPLGNSNQFHGLTPTPKVSGFPWRDQCIVRPCPRRGASCPPAPVLVLHRDGARPRRGEGGCAGVALPSWNNGLCLVVLGWWS